MFFAFLIIALILGAIWPAFDPEPLLLVLEPATAIAGAIKVGVLAVSVRSIFTPLALVDVSVYMDQPPLAIGHAVGPVALIRGAIVPYLKKFSFLTKYLFAFAVLEAVLPLAIIDSIIL